MTIWDFIHQTYLKQYIKSTVEKQGQQQQFDFNTGGANLLYNTALALSIGGYVSIASWHW